MRELEELVALIPPELRPPGARPRLDCKATLLEGVVHQLDLHVPEVPDPASCTAIDAILKHPHTRDVRRLGISRSCEEWPRPTDSDFGWVLDLIARVARPAALEWLFVHEPAKTTMDPIARFARTPRTLVSYNKLTRFVSATFRGVERLDLRDTDVEWSCSADAFPDLTTLIIRPRGPNEIGARWATAIFARPRVLPRLREVRAPEERGDDVLDLLLPSPLLDQLRCLDFTNALTDRGAMALYENASRLEDVEELWIATTTERRHRWAAHARAALPPPGNLEITDAWRQRLRQRFGRRVRFDVRPHHPDL
jgi:hypothetical protein